MRQNWVTLNRETEVLRSEREALERQLAEVQAARVAAENRHKEAVEQLRLLQQEQARAIQAAEQEMGWRLREAEEDFEAQREALHGAVQCLRLELAAAGLARDEAEARVRWLGLEGERLGRELRETRHLRDEDAQARQAYESRIKTLDQDLVAARTQADSLGQRLRAAQAAMTEHQGLAKQVAQRIEALLLEIESERRQRQQAEEDLGKERLAAREGRQERQEMAEALRGLGGELEDARRGLAELASERESLLEQARHSGELLERQRQQAEASVARLEEQARLERQALLAEADAIRNQFESTREALQKQIEAERRRADAAEQEMGWRLREAEEDFEAQREALHGAVQCLRLELAAAGLARDEAEARVRWLGLEGERLGRELRETRHLRDEDAQARQAYESRIKTLDQDLVAARTQADSLGQRLRAAQAAMTEHQGLAKQAAQRIEALLLEIESERRQRQQAEEDLGKERLAALTGRQEMAEALRGLGGELEDARRGLAELASERESLLEQARHSGELLERQRQQAEASVARLEEQARLERQALLAEADAIRNQFESTREALQRSEGLLAQAREELVRQRKQRDQSDALAAGLAQRQHETESRQRSDEELRRALEQQAVILKQEIARLQQELAQQAEASAVPIARAPDDTVWQMVAVGEVTLPSVPVAVPRPGDLVPRPSRPAPTGNKSGIAVAALLRMLSMSKVPNAAALEDARKQLGARALATVLAISKDGDAEVRRGAARLCFYLAEWSHKQGDAETARVAAKSASVMLQQQLQGPAPDATMLRVELLAVQIALSRWLREGRETAGAVQSLQVARDAAQSLVAEQPEAKPYRRALARCLHDLGAYLMTAGQPVEALGHLRQAIAHQHTAMRGLPATTPYATELELMKRTLQKCMSQGGKQVKPSAHKRREALASPD